MKKSNKLFLFGKLRDLESATFVEDVKRDIAEFVGIDEDIPFDIVPQKDGVFSS